MKCNPLLLALLVGCTRPTSNEALTRAIDSLAKEVSLLRMELNKCDSAEMKSSKTYDTIVNERFKDNGKRIKPQRDTVKTKEAKKEADSDTLFYKFTDGRLSVKVHPWQNGKQIIEVFSVQGDVVYTMENARLSYQVSNTLHFRPDGSLDKVKSHMNPGASLYWYESITRFDTDNQPSWMMTYQYPQMSALDAMGEKYLWKRSEKRWVKQEYIEETNTLPGQ